MKDTFTIHKGSAFPLGVSVEENRIHIVIELHARKECGLVLKKEDGTISRIPFLPEYQIGTYYCVEIESIDWRKYSYTFYEDASYCKDRMAKKLEHPYLWGEKKEKEFYSFYEDTFLWEQDKNPMIPYEDCIMYGLHVRGFTKSDSSKCKGKGTFLGIQEKIPYLKDLGITSLELQPLYEFDEVEEQFEHADYMSERYRNIPTGLQKENLKINYWGYKPAYYMMPKSAYSYSKDPVTELKQLIRELHRNHMELIMQLYFPNDMNPSYIMEVLHFWVLNYHVDGFHLKGNDLPFKTIYKDPLLKKTKIIYYGFELNEIYQQAETPDYRNLGIFRNDFMETGRKYLKGDNDTLSRMFDLLRFNPEKAASIQYLTNYDTFTMADIFSYEAKHNEENGENNSDGTNYNDSWNCGVEGPSRKKEITELRLQMHRDAFLLLMIAAGTPFFMAGDEFMNSQNGNNNPYCIDNATTWLNWKWNKKEEEMQKYVKNMIAFRKEHAQFRRKRAYTLMDSIGCHYPDLSVHSDEPWKAKLENYNHSIGLMYCGRYSNQQEDIYVACNMYWQPYSFALPKLEAGRKWETYLDTAAKKNVSQKESEDNKTVQCEARSIKILIGR